MIADCQLPIANLNPLIRIPLISNWKLEIKKFAAKQQLNEWADVFRLELRDYQPVDHLQAYSITAFLLRSDPQRFIKMAKSVGEGKGCADAIEEAYETPIEKLQQQWFAWLIRQ